jgi:hypothetical protein
MVVNRCCLNACETSVMWRGAWPVTLWNRRSEKSRFWYESSAFGSAWLRLRRWVRREAGPGERVGFAARRFCAGGGFSRA